MPPGKAVNDYSTEEWHQKFARVDDAAALVTKLRTFLQPWMYFPIKQLIQVVKLHEDLYKYFLAEKKVPH